MLQSKLRSPVADHGPWRGPPSTASTSGRSRAVARDTAVHASMDRRGVLSMSAACVALSGFLPHQAQADVQDLVSWIYAPAPEPVLFPRKALDQRFAVLLMRSTYDAVDDLDFIPMDSFQIKFWKYRQSEQEGYNLQYSPLKARLGDLTDPLYFDFISYSQYAVIGNGMAKGEQVFKEFCEECPDQSKVVRRNPEFADNALLPARFNKVVGDKIYDGLLNGFREEVFGAPAPLPARSSVQDLANAIQAILDIMVDRGYALKAQVSNVVDGPEPTFDVKIQGPVNLWGLAALANRRSQVVNTYDAFVIDAYLRACGRTASFESSYSSVGVEQTWTLQA